MGKAKPKFIDLEFPLNREMRKTCSNCGSEYWVNVHVDGEYACPKCAFVEEERIIGQREGRISIADE